MALAVAQIKGWSLDNIPRFPPTSSLPDKLPAYIPVIHHGSNVSFSKLSDMAPWAAIPLSRILVRCKRSEKLRPRFSTEAALRKRFSLQQDTRILALGVGFDQFIEDYWQDNLVEKLPAVLRGLGVDCMIPPNFSMFRDVVRPQHLFNRKRSLLCALRAAEAGLSVIPYLSALTEQDWRTFERFLLQHPEIRHVAEEFQTGTAERELGLSVIRRIAELQDRLKRALHPVLIGALRFSVDAHKFFDSWTLMDSNAFFDAQCRRRPLFRGGRFKRGQASGETVKNFARSVRWYVRRAQHPKVQCAPAITANKTKKTRGTSPQLPLF